MKKTLNTPTLLFISILFFTSGYAQDALTIEESISGAYTTFSPERIKDLKWIPGSQTFSFKEGDGRDETIMRGYVDSRPPEKITDLAKIRQSFEGGGFVSPEEIPPFDWISSKSMMFSFKGQYFELDLESEILGKRISASRAIVNRDLSPDHALMAGTYLNNLYISNSQRDSIPITFNKDEGIVSGQAVSRYEFGISKGTFWSNDSRKIAFYVKDEREVSDYDLIDYAPIPAAPSPVKYPMAGKTSEIVKVKVYNLKNKKTIELATDIPRGDYITSVTWTEKDKAILLGHVDRSQNNFQLVKYDAASGKKEAVLFSEFNDKYVEPEHAPYILKGKKGQFLWFSERDGFNHLYRYSADGKLMNQVTIGEKVMSKILHVDLVNEIVYVQGTDSPLETVVYSVPLKGGEMTRVTSEEGVHRATFCSNGKYFIDTYSSIESPRVVKVKDIRGRELNQLLSAEDPLAGKKIGQTEVYTIPAEDGTDLYCRMIKPSDFDASKKYPALVYVYNGPHVQLIRNSWLGGASLWMHYMAERGYLIFTLDGRGSKARGLEFEQAVHRQLGILETKDQMTGVSHLKSLPYVDSEKMAIHGWSFGGFMTLNLMLREPGTFQVGVAGGAVTDWRFYEAMYTERYMDEPKDNPDGYEQSRVIGLAGQLEGDLMLVHGTSDDVVVPQHCMVMLNSFINADKQVDLFLYPGHKHNVRGADRVHLMTKILDYIEEKLN